MKTKKANANYQIIIIKGGSAFIGCVIEFYFKFFYLIQ